MKANYIKFALLLMALSMLLVSGCGNDKPNSIAQFSPEIINNADAFQFQVTGATNVTTALSYTWQNAGTQATINHSSVVSEGTATVTILDASQTQVYTSGLVASANETSEVGATGAWTVQVALVGVSGTLNFRVETLTP